MFPSPSPHSSVRTALRRFWPLVLLAALIGAAAAAAASYRAPVEYSSTAIYLVPPANVPSGSTVTPYDAERLARTYAVVVAEDEQLLGVLAEAVQRSPRATARRTSTVTLPNSAAVRVTYRGKTRGEVSTYFDALTDAVQGSSPPTPNIAANTMRLLNVDPVIARSGGGSWVAGLAGGIAGLLLGLAAAAYLARANPRVRGASDLREPGGPAVLDLDLGTPDSIDALAVRALDTMPQDARVAVLTTASRSADVERLAATLDRAAARLLAAGSLHESYAGTAWQPAVLGRGGERAAQDADRTLLVVGKGHRLPDLAAALSDLHDLGVSDVLVAVSRGRAPKAPSAEVPTSAPAAAAAAARPAARRRAADVDANAR